MKASSENVRNYNHIRVPTFILSGAPIFQLSDNLIGWSATTKLGKLAVIARQPFREATEGRAIFVVSVRLSVGAFPRLARRVVPPLGITARRPS